MTNKEAEIISSFISKYKDKELSKRQAINISSASTGVSKNEIEETIKYSSAKNNIKKLKTYDVFSLIRDDCSISFEFDTDIEHVIKIIQFCNILYDLDLHDYDLTEKELDTLQNRKQNLVNVLQKEKQWIIDDIMPSLMIEREIGEINGIIY